MRRKSDGVESESIHVNAKDIRKNSCKSGKHLWADIQEDFRKKCCNGYVAIWGSEFRAKAGTTIRRLQMLPVNELEKFDKKGTSPDVSHVSKPT